MRTLNGSELETDTHTIYRISTHGCTLLVPVVFFFVLHPLSHSWASTVSDLTSEPHTDMMHTHWIQTIICTIQFKRNSSQQNWTTTVFAFEYYSRSIYLSISELDWIGSISNTNAWPQPPRKEQERRCRWNLLLLILQIIMLQICIRSYVCHLQKTRVAPICAFIVYFGNALVYGFFKLRSCSCTKTPFSSSSWFYL
jgi:hypothetical protein